MGRAAAFLPAFLPGDLVLLVFFLAIPGALVFASSTLVTVMLAGHAVKCIEDVPARRAKIAFSLVTPGGRCRIYRRGD